MIISLTCHILISTLTHYMFVKEKIPQKYDFFNCYKIRWVIFFQNILYKLSFLEGFFIISVPRQLISSYTEIFFSLQQGFKGNFLNFIMEFILIVVLILFKKYIHLICLFLHKKMSVNLNNVFIQCFWTVPQLDWLNWHPLDISTT